LCVVAEVIHYGPERFFTIVRKCVLTAHYFIGAQHLQMRMYFNV
jgi:hypothetical protein